jgi:hypothetical protein
VPQIGDGGYLLPLKFGSASVTLAVAIDLVMALRRRV